MLRELTISHPKLWVRVFDTDGEFLLVEAANVLPKWLSPETDRNRVWIHNGKLLLVPSGANHQPATHQLGLVSLPEAVGFIKAKPSDLVHSTFVESEAFYRLERYPAQVADSLHHSLVTIPRKLAYILHSLPQSVAPAVEAFYLRDPTGLRPIISATAALKFAPDDLVTISVRFSKVLFAQLRSQPFEAPPRWQSAFQSSGEKTESTEEAQKHTARLDIGMKLTCGFEMLAVNAEKSRSRVVRELAIIIEDLQEDGEEALPSNETMNLWQDGCRDDDEGWMDINYDDFERELDGKRRPPGQTKSGFGDARTQADLKKIVSRFEAFLNDDDAGVEGAELDDMDIDDDDEDSETDEEGDSEAEDKEVSFDEEEFARMMREMMGLPSTEPPLAEAGKGKGKAPAGPAPDKPAALSEEDAQIQELASQMETELKEHGAFRQDASTEKRSKLKETGKEKENQEAGEEDSEDDAEEVDIDYNLAKNLLESFKSQAGMAGPTGNLLGMMGFQLPRDEDDGNDGSQPGQADPSGASR